MGEALVCIPNTTVYQVEQCTNAVMSISNGDFIVAYANSQDGACLEAQAGAVRWTLGQWVAVLHFDERTYAFRVPPPTGATAAAGPTGHPPGADVYYCLTLGPDTPLELIELLQAILASGTAYHDYQHLHGPTDGAADGQRGAASPGAVPGSSTKADRLDAGLQRGGQLAAAGVLAAATWAGLALQRGADAAVARIQPSYQPYQELSPQAQARLEGVKSAAAQAAEVSSRAVAGALSVTASVASHLAQRIADTDLGHKISRSKVGGVSMQDMRKVGVAGVEAAEAVYNSLADAARILLAHTHMAATQVAAHKYGIGAGQATGAGFQVTQSVMETGLNLFKLRPTALMKKAVKGMAKNVVMGRAGNQISTSEQQPQQPQVPRVVTADSPLQSQHPSLPPAGLAAAVSTMGVFTALPQRPPEGPSATPQHLEVVDGTPVSGPVLGQPVMTSVATFQMSSEAGPLRAAVVDSHQRQEIPYPTASSSQYTAGYYPAIPHA